MITGIIITLVLIIIIYQEHKIIEEIRTALGIIDNILEEQERRIKKLENQDFY